MIVSEKILEQIKADIKNIKTENGYFFNIADANCIDGYVSLDAAKENTVYFMPGPKSYTPATESKRTSNVVAEYFITIIFIKDENGISYLSEKATSDLQMFIRQDMSIDKSKTLQLNKVIVDTGGRGKVGVKGWALTNTQPSFYMPNNEISKGDLTAKITVNYVEPFDQRQVPTEYQTGNP